MRPIELQPYVAGLLLAIMPAFPWDHGLDPSWAHLLLHLWDIGGVFGEDFVFTYGPLGPLVSHVGLTPVWWWIWKAFLVFCGLMWAGMVREIGRNHGQAWGWYATLATGLVLFRWTPWEIFLNLLLFLQLTRHALHRGSWWRAWSSGLLLTILCYAKLSLAVPSLAGAMLAIAFANNFKKRLQLVLAIAVPLVLGAMFLPVSLGYITKNADIISGYGPSMWWPTSASLAVWSLLGLAVWTGAIGFSRPGLRERLFMLAMAASFLLVTYRSGFTRADWGHQLRFFGILPLLPMWLLVHPTGQANRRNLVMTALSLLALGAFLSSHSIQKYMQKKLTGVGQLIWSDHLSAFATAEDKKDMPELPQELLDQIGDATIDVFPIELDLAYLSGLNLRTRPIPQSYSVYTSRLEQVNASHYLGDSAPEFVLFAGPVFQPFYAIDRRLPLNDDFPALQALRGRYRPVSSAEYPYKGGHGTKGKCMLLARQDNTTGPFPAADHRVALSVAHHVTIPLPSAHNRSNLMVLEVKDLALRWQHRIRDSWFRTDKEKPLLTAWLPDGRVETFRLTPRADGTMRAVLAFPLPQDSLAMLWQPILPDHIFPDSIQIHLPAHKRIAYPAELWH